MGSCGMIICLMGPTATGKSELAIQLAHRFNAEIISVDSALIYEEMDIGTAKPSKEIRAQISHHLIDIRKPHETYSAAEFLKDARCIIQSIQHRGRLPLLVGGTMLYFHVLQQGLSALPSADQTVRTALMGVAAQQGWPHLHARLKKVDPLSAEKIHPNDAQRIQRALEVYELTGQPLSELASEHLNIALNEPTLNIILEPPSRKWLHERIALRFEQMLAAGFIKEVENLYQRDNMHRNLPSIRSVGYRQIWQYLDGEFDEILMKEKANAATRQLAKRQLTWLRRWQNVIRFDCQQPQLFEEVSKSIQEFI